MTLRPLALRLGAWFRATAPMGAVQGRLDDPASASIFVLLSAWILGSWVGEEVFSAVYGLRVPDLQQPWWYSLFFLLVGIALFIRADDRLFRIGFLVLGARYGIALAEATIVEARYPGLQRLLLIASALLFLAAGWSNARRWARVAGCIAFLALAPVRYWMLESMTGVRSVLGP